MFIRKTKVKTAVNGGDDYYTYRIVESERIGSKVKQRTLLNLGKHFSIEPGQWPFLCARIKQIFKGQSGIFDDEPSLDPGIESAAQRYAALILQKQSQPVPAVAPKAATVDDNSQTPGAQAPQTDYQFVDVNQLELFRPRSIGVESVAYSGIEQLELPQCLSALGFNSKELAAAMGHIVGRLASPGSERQTLRWLQHQSGLGEVLNHDFETTSLTRLYEVSDQLYRHRKAIEQHLSQREVNLFNLKRHIILYDLTNTYFEGQALGNTKAQFGRSKEKRSDCRLVTLGLTLDGDGFPLRSRMFAGNIGEARTLQEMVEQLHDDSLASVDSSAAQNPIIIMDAGIATEENIAWLRNQGYRYIVVSRDRKKPALDWREDATVVKKETGNHVVARKVVDEQAQEVRVYCHSEGKEKKEQSIQAKFSQRFETALTRLNDGLSKKGCTKRYEKVLERIGRLKQKNPHVANNYHIEVQADSDKTLAGKITWKRQSVETTDESLGVYCLRSNILDWKADALWCTYVMLTEVEATFRSLKTDFGLRPVYHQKEDRVSAHIFISLLAYHIAHTLRFQLKSRNVHLSWSSLRQVLSTQQRVTVALPTAEGKTIHVRSTSRAETEQKNIYTALGLPTDRIGKRKTIMENN